MNAVTACLFPARNLPTGTLESAVTVLELLSPPRNGPFLESVLGVFTEQAVPGGGACSVAPEAQAAVYQKKGCQPLAPQASQGAGKPDGPC